MNTAAALLGAWSAGLLRAMLEGALFALAVFVLCRALPRMPAFLRAALWWFASLKLLVATVGLVTVAVPVLPAAPHTATTAPVVTRADRPSRSLAIPLAFVDDPAPRSPADAWRDLRPLVLAALALLWAGGVARRGTRIAREYAAHRRLLHDARPVTDGIVLDDLRGLARALGVRVPELLEGGDADAPFVMGLRRARIVIPRDLLETLPPAERRMALAHELAHLLRRDLWLGWVPAAAATVFWFFPPAWLAAREYAQAREEACDALALAATGDDPARYAGLLLALGVVRRGGSMPAACAASPHFRHLKRRLLMLEQTGTWTGRRRALAIAAVTLLSLGGLLSFRVVAAETPAPKATPATPAAVAPAPPATPAVTVKSAPPAPPRAPLPPPAPPAPPAPRRASWVLVTGDDVIMNGDADVDRLQEKYGEHFLYFRRNGKAYVVTDPATLEQVRTALGPSEDAEPDPALELKQAEIELEHAKLAQKQAEIARAQAELNLAAARTKTGDEASRQKLEQQRDELERQVDALDKELEPVEQQIEKLADEQERLGHERERAIEDAQRKVEGSFDELIRKGVAQPAK